MVVVAVEVVVVVVVVVVALAVAAVAVEMGWWSTVNAGSSALTVWANDASTPQKDQLVNRWPAQ